MRTSATLVSSLCWMLCAASVQAQSYQQPSNTVPIVRSPSSSVRSTNVNSSSGAYWTQDQQTQPSPNDRSGAAAPAAPANQDVPAPPQNGSQSVVGPALQVQSNAATMPDECYERSSCCNIGEPFRIFGKSQCGLEIGGWGQFGYYSDSDGLWNTRDDKLNLDQAWIFIERKAPRCCDGFGLGFRVDGIYGTNGELLQAFGNPPVGSPDGWDNDLDHGAYAWAVPQAYGELTYNRWSIIGGHYISPMGYESVMSPKNFFYSRSFARTNILPTTFTGTMSTWSLWQDTTAYTGVTTNWDTAFDRVNDDYNFLAGFAYKPCAPVQVTGFITTGDTGYREDGTTSDLFVDVMLTDKLNYIGAWTYEDSDTAYQLAFGNYLIYRVNECLGLGSRFEWYKSTIYNATADSTYSWTTGINFRRSANVIVRPELRVDWGEGAVDEGQPIFACDLIATF